MAVAAIAIIFEIVGREGGLTLGIVAGWLFLLIAIHGYAVALVLGIPSYLLFCRLGWIRRAHWVLLCAALGSVAGAAWPALIMMGEFGSDSGTAATAISAFAGAGLLAGALVGAVSGLVFSLVIKIEPPRIDEIASTFD